MNRSFSCITLLRCEENRCTFLTLTKGYTPETSVYFFEGICYFLVFFVMKLSLLHLSKVQVSPFYSPFIKRREVLLCFGHKYLSLFLVGEQRRRENRKNPQQTWGLFLESPAVTFRVACVADALNLRARAPLGEFFLERGANLESRAAHTHPKNTKCPPRGQRKLKVKLGVRSIGKSGFRF